MIGQGKAASQSGEQRRRAEPSLCGTHKSTVTIGRIINRLGETDAFHRAGLVAIDTTEEDPFTDDREGHEDEIIGRNEKTDEYAYQWATVQLVGNAVPLVLDARPIKKRDCRQSGSYHSVTRILIGLSGTIVTAESTPGSIVGDSRLRR